VTAIRDGQVRPAFWREKPEIASAELPKSALLAQFSTAQTGSAALDYRADKPKATKGHRAWRSATSNKQLKYFYLWKLLIDSESRYHRE
jgi:hypothetical protein